MPPPSARLNPPDEILLRRFGLVRVVGGAAYTLVVMLALVFAGLQVWPLLLGIPVLAGFTIAYLIRSYRYPRTMIVASLVADAVVLAIAIAVLGGTSTGLAGLFAIVIVSGGILLGTAAALGFTLLTVLLSFAQLGLEELGILPPVLYRDDFGTRLAVLLVSVAGLLSVGYLTASYAGRLHGLIAEAAAKAEVVRRRGARRVQFLRRASLGVREPLAEIEAIADQLQERWQDLPGSERQRLAARLRISVTQVAAEAGQLADVGAIDAPGDQRPEPLLLPRVVQDCIVALGERLDPYTVDLDLRPLKVLGDRRAARRVVYNLLENIVDHTPAGTVATVRARSTGGWGVLVISDNGPGIPPELIPALFQAGDEGGVEGRPARVGLPLVRELCEGMGATVRYEQPRQGHGSRILVGFRLAPRGAPTFQEEGGVASDDADAEEPADA